MATRVQENIKEETKAKRAKVKEAQSNNLKSPKKLKALFVIVSRKKTDFYVDLLQTYSSNMQTICYGKGTAPDAIRKTLLQVEDSYEKSLIIAIIQEEKEDMILNALKDRFDKIKGGRGVAFSVSLKSTIGVLVYKFLSDNRGDDVWN